MQAICKQADQPQNTLLFREGNRQEFPSPVFQEAIDVETAEEEPEELDQAIEVKIGTKGEHRKEIFICIIFMFI